MVGQPNPIWDSGRVLGRFLAAGRSVWVRSSQRWPRAAPRSHQQTRRAPWRRLALAELAWEAKLPPVRMTRPLQGPGSGCQCGTELHEGTQKQRRSGRRRRDVAFLCPGEGAPPLPMRSDPDAAGVTRSSALVPSASLALTSFGF